MKAGNPETTWDPIERVLRSYADRVPARLFGNVFDGREGFYVLVRFLVLLGALIIVFMHQPILKIIATLLLPTRGSCSTNLD